MRNYVQLFKTMKLFYRKYQQEQIITRLGDALKKEVDKLDIIKLALLSNRTEEEFIQCMKDLLGRGKSPISKAVEDTFRHKNNIPPNIIRLLADEFKKTEAVSSDNEATRDKVVAGLNTLADELTPTKTDGSTLEKETEIPAVTVAQLNTEIAVTVEETTKFKDKE